MLLRDSQIRVKLNMVVDGAIFALSLWLAWAIRNYWVVFGADSIAPFKPHYYWLFLVIIPMSPLVLDWQGFYDRVVLSPIRIMLLQLASACTICAVGLILIEFMLKEDGARMVFVLFGGWSFVLMLVKEQAVRSFYRTEIGQARFKRRIVIAGDPADIKRLLSDVSIRTGELEVCGEFPLNSTPIDELVAMLHLHSINAVVIAARHTYFDRVEKVVRACELEGVEIWLLSDFFQTQISQTSLDRFYGRPVLVFRSAGDISWQRVAKQVIDFVGALALLLVFSLPMVFAAILIKATSPGPILFRQKRAGLNGRPFVMYKFRSMVSNAEQLKQELERLNEMSGPVFKVTSDPRVTRIGRVLRKYSIDEMPQLINVLRWEMSLVGPRPLPVDEVGRFDDVSHRRRLSVRPGLTCTWQVSGRNNVTDFKDWVRMDLEYIDHWSLWLDIKILWRTIWVVLRGTGAR